MNKYIQFISNVMLWLISVAFIGTLIIYNATITDYKTSINNYKQDNAILVELSESLINYTTAVNEEIQLRQDLTSLIIDASRAYNIDPKLFAINIKSEGNLDQTQNMLYLMSKALLALIPKPTINSNTMHIVMLGIFMHPQRFYLVTSKLQIASL